MMRLLFIGSIALLAMVTLPASAAPSLVVDAASGRVLHEDEAGRPWLPASLTKMMTAYVALKQVQRGRLSLDSGLVISARATKQAPSKMGFKAGTVVTLDNALKIIMVKSANDVSVAIAEGIGGSVEGFVGMMNAEAQRLGMSGTHFANPNGLPGGVQSITARDMAILARAMLAEFPDQSQLWGMPAIQYGNTIIRNHNHLIGRYPGADGFKTGFVCASGFNVVATATRGGRKLIAVVLGETSARGRAEKAARLFEASFASFGGGRGNLESLQNTGGAVANIRETVCRKRGKDTIMPESGEYFDAEAPTNDGNASVYAAMRFNRPLGEQAIAGQMGAGPSYLMPYAPTMAPVPVFIGGSAKVAKPVSPAKPAANAQVAPAPRKPAPAGRQQTVSAPVIAEDTKPAAAPPQTLPAEPTMRPAGSLLSLPTNRLQQRAPGSLMPSAPVQAAPMALQGAAAEPTPAQQNMPALQAPMPKPVGTKAAGAAKAKTKAAPKAATR